VAAQPFVIVHAGAEKFSCYTCAEGATIESFEMPWGGAATITWLLRLP
jgi:hypothetical protein